MRNSLNTLSSFYTGSRDSQKKPCCIYVGSVVVKHICLSVAKVHLCTSNRGLLTGQGAMVFMSFSVLL